jgi:hypothetical protein
MTEQENAPPEKGVSPSASQGARANQQVSRDTTTTANDDNRSGARQPFDVLAGNARRLGASRRMVPMPPCSCVRDPGCDRHRCDGAVSDHQAEAAVAAVAHLDELGTPGLLDERTCRAMWRIGHRALAEAVHRRTAGAQ